MTTKFVCVHGHFYQPPRENAWLEAIEAQDSARPFHDWNERITAECYRPNAFSRILDERGHIQRIVSNYERISFNFGPTLLSWLAVDSPEIHAAIVAADHTSRERFGGHGSALAQPYNHMILPLAHPRDKVTQVRWGLRDFQHRFGRDAEGMWLPETAVDLATLEVLAEQGLRFTVLAPRQAARVRPIQEDGGGEWTDVSGERVDPSRAYLQRLPSGRSIALFFYDGPVSRAVAFEGLLDRGENLAQRLLGLFPAGDDQPRLAHIATDGESYGHHHHHGDMALAFALQTIDARDDVELCNYGQWLERFPPRHEVEIVEQSSWSCIHGIERWRSDCGCNTGRGQGWKQTWRAPLREALDWLRDRSAELFERRGGPLLREPWAARDAYVEVLLEREAENLERFLSEHAKGSPEGPERVEILRLLEMQRFAQLMYTSCGWFFDELSGMETVQVLQYAARVIQLAEQIDGSALEEAFLERLAKAPSNLPEHRDGAEVYRKLVRTHRVTLPWVGAHFAVSSLFQRYGERTRIFGYRVEREAERVLEHEGDRLQIGRIRVVSEVTGESERLSYAVLHFGAHSVHGGVRVFEGEEAFEGLQAELVGAFELADLPAVVHIVDQRFDGPVYSLRSLFRDEQRRIVERLLEQSLREEDEVYRQLYERHAPLMRFVVDVGVPLPNAFRTTIEFVLDAKLREELRGSPIDVGRVRQWVEEARRCGAELDAASLAYTLRRALQRRLWRLARTPQDMTELAALENELQAAAALPFEIDRSDAQNLYWKLREEQRPKLAERAASSEAARTWLERFDRIGEALAVRVG